MLRNSCSIWRAEASRSTCAIASRRRSTSRRADWQSAGSRSSFTLTKIQNTMKGDRRRRQSLLRVCGRPFSVFLVKLDVWIFVCTGRAGTLPDTSHLGKKDCQETGCRKCEFHLSPLAQKTSFLQNRIVICRNERIAQGMPSFIIKINRTHTCNPRRSIIEEDNVMETSFHRNSMHPHF